MVATGWPVLVSLSRKDFVGETLDRPVADRLAGHAGRHRGERLAGRPGVPGPRRRGDPRGARHGREHPRHPAAGPGGARPRLSRSVRAARPAGPAPSGRRAPARRTPWRPPPRRSRCSASSRRPGRAHSPTGSRRTCTVSSVLRNRQAAGSSAADTPDAESTQVSSRCTGLVGSPSTQVDPWPHPHRAGTRLGHRADDPAPLHGVEVARGPAGGRGLRRPVGGRVRQWLRGPAGPSDGRREQPRRRPRAGPAAGRVVGGRLAHLHGPARAYDGRLHGQRRRPGPAPAAPW